jgi:tartrate dehydrogenase/decarboxylase/D-malate dehydrogenase
MLIVREYAGAGGRFKVGTPDEVALQTSIFTRKGIERVVDYAFKLCLKRTKKIALATKSNAMQYGMVLWDEIFEEYASKYKSQKLQVEKYHIDALVAKLITKPWEFDVIVASNLFGDIITDLIGAMQGSLGVPASANINPEKKFPSLFESVHGSAIDIVGRGIANPIATFEGLK